MNKAIKLAIRLKKEVIKIEKTVTTLKSSPQDFSTTIKAHEREIYSRNRKIKHILKNIRHAKDYAIS